MKTVTLLLLSFCTLQLKPVKPQPKIVDTCKVVTVKNQVACKKVIVGVFPDNPNGLGKNITKR